MNWTDMIPALFGALQTGMIVGGMSRGRRRRLIIIKHIK
jgi:hypothetical protein